MGSIDHLRESEFDWLYLGQLAAMRRDPGSRTSSDLLDEEDDEDLEWDDEDLDEDEDDDEEDEEDDEDWDEDDEDWEDDDEDWDEDDEDWEDEEEDDDYASVCGPN